MVHSHVEHTPKWGEVLWLEDGNISVGVALDFGIRVVHLSCAGMENLYYEQPVDLSDGFTTEGGWKLRGGHRIWMAPESDDSYCPDNAPISYSLTERGAVITQQPDGLLGIVKRLELTFLPDGGVELYQSLENVSDTPIQGASWGVNTLDKGGVARIPFTDMGRGGYTAHRVVSLWSDTNLHDPRLYFDKDGLTATYMPSADYLKIGLYSLEGKAVFENKGQRFTLLFDSEPLDQYPDNGCNFELYMCSQFIELETLGRKVNILPGQTTGHKETWYLTKA